jgi:DNA gyrase subunit A
MFVCSSHDTIMFFTASGRVYAEQAYTIPEMSRSARGKSIANFLQLESEEEINILIPINDFEAKVNLMMVTKRGQVKKTPIRLYRNIRKSGLTAIKLREGDELIDVKLTDGESNILIATKDGMAIKFEETDVRPMGRSAMGVRGIRLREEDEVIGMVVAREDEAFTTVTKFGYGKRSLFENYRLTGRGCRGVINIKFFKELDEVIAVKGGLDTQQIIVATKNGIVLRTSNEDIRMISRVGKGVKVVRLDEGDEVAAVAVADAEEDKGEVEEVCAEEPSEAGEEPPCEPKSDSTPDSDDDPDLSPGPEENEEE